MAFLRVILGFSVSGQKSLAAANDAGADITDAVNKWEDGTCNFRRKKANLGLAFFLCSEEGSKSLCKGRNRAGVVSMPEDNVSLEVWKSHSSSLSQVAGITLRG